MQTDASVGAGAVEPAPAAPPYVHTVSNFYVVWPFCCVFCCFFRRGMLCEGALFHDSVCASTLPCVRSKSNRLPPPPPHTRVLSARSSVVRRVETSALCMKLQLRPVVPNLVVDKRIGDGGGQWIKFGVWANRTRDHQSFTRQVRCC